MEECNDQFWEKLVPTPHVRYRLFNKKDNRFLEHPLVGIWGTLDLEDARSCLAACHEWLKADGLNNLSENFVILDAVTQEEISG